MKKLLIVLLLTMTFLVGCTGPSFDFERGVLIVGLECDYAPFNWLETEPSETNVRVDGMNAYAEGYDVQIARLIADDLGLELVIKMVDWSGLIPALQSGMIDVIIAGMSPKPDRMKQISFSDAYYTTEHVVIVRKDGAYANATDLNDFANARIIGQKDTTYDTLANQLATRNQATHQTPLARVPEIVNAINSGISDVTIVEKPVAESIVLSNTNLKYIQLATPFDLDESDTIVSIGVRKVDTELLEALNNSLVKITNTMRISLMQQATSIAPEDN